MKTIKFETDFMSLGNKYFATHCEKLSWQEYQLGALESFTLVTLVKSDVAVFQLRLSIVEYSKLLWFDSLAKNGINFDLLLFNLNRLMNRTEMAFYLNFISYQFLLMFCSDSFMICNIHCVMIDDDDLI